MLQQLQTDELIRRTRNLPALGWKLAIIASIDTLSISKSDAHRPAVKCTVKHLSVTDFPPTNMRIALFLAAAAQGRCRLELGRVCPSVLTQSIWAFSKPGCQEDYKKI